MLLCTVDSSIPFEESTPNYSHVHPPHHSTVMNSTKKNILESEQLFRIMKSDFHRNNHGDEFEDNEEEEEEDIFSIDFSKPLVQQALAGELLVLRKENKRLKSQLQRDQIAIQNHEHAIAQVRHTAEEITLLEAEEIARLENEVEKLEIEKKKWISSCRQAEIAADKLFDELQEIKRKEFDRNERQRLNDDRNGILSDAKSSFTKKAFPEKNILDEPNRWRTPLYRLTLPSEPNYSQTIYPRGGASVSVSTDRWTSPRHRIDMNTPNIDISLPAKRHEDHYIDRYLSPPVAGQGSGYREELSPWEAGSSHEWLVEEEEKRRGKMFSNKSDRFAFS